MAKSTEKKIEGISLTKNFPLGIRTLTGGEEIVLWIPMPIQKTDQEYSFKRAVEESPCRKREKREKISRNARNWRRGGNLEKYIYDKSNPPGLSARKGPFGSKKKKKKKNQRRTPFLKPFFPRKERTQSLRQD